ncbi:hypothetical protein E2320_010333, partial [Naja naja]
GSNEEKSRLRMFTCSSLGSFSLVKICSGRRKKMKGSKGDHLYFFSRAYLNRINSLNLLIRLLICLLLHPKMFPSGIKACLSYTLFLIFSPSK